MKALQWYDHGTACGAFPFSIMKSSTLVLLAVAAFLYYEWQKQQTQHPIIPGLQPGGCQPGDPGISFGGQTYCFPQGIIPY